LFVCPIGGIIAFLDVFGKIVEDVEAGAFEIGFGIEDAIIIGFLPDGANVLCGVLPQIVYAIVVYQGFICTYDVQ